LHGSPRGQLAAYSLVSARHPESPGSGRQQPMLPSLRVKRKSGSYFEQVLLSTAIHWSDGDFRHFEGNFSALWRAASRDRSRFLEWSTPD